MSVATAHAAPPDPMRPVVAMKAAAGPLVLTERDLSPRFLDFFAAARSAPVAERMPLWRARYDFAAVPPGPRGDAMVAKLLADAWPRYRAAVPALRRGAAPHASAMRARLAKVAALLDAPAGTRMNVIWYVGGFEDNAYTMRDDSGVPTLALPLESPASFRNRATLHEGTHAIHMALAGLSGAFERPIAQVIVEEGLAMRVTQRLSPGLPDAAITEHRPGWHSAAMAKAPAILAALRPKLALSDGQSVFDATMGTGTSGLDRETYLAGWLVVGAWLRDGETPASIARIKPEAMAARVGATIDRLLVAPDTIR